MSISANNNFSVEYNTRLSGFTGNQRMYLVSPQGKLKQSHCRCPYCGSSDHVDNGYHLVENSLICSLGLDIGIGQFQCKRCGKFWSSNREIVDTFIHKEKEFTKSLMLGCVRKGLSLANSVQTIGEKMGTTYSPQYLNELYIAALEQVKSEKFSSASGVYHYDEQHLKANGEEYCRLTIRDAVDGKVIVDKETKDAKKETIMMVLSEGLAGLPVERFIVDMLPMYPDLIHELFPKAKIQWCIFHLDQQTWRDMCKEYGRRIPLLQLYNAYTLFDIFFDHSMELNKIQELLKQFQVIKTSDPKNNTHLENTLCKEFREYVRSLKKARRRKHERIPRRVLQESEQRFALIKKQILIFPKCLQKRIRYIEENWEKFTLFQRDSRVPPTNNGIEQYFGATLSKTEKKNFRSVEAITRELNAAQAEWNGKRIFPMTATLLEVILAAGMLLRIFAPP